MTSTDLSTMGDKTPRARRTKAEMDEIRLAIIKAIAIDAPTSVRSVFYRLVSMGAIPKTEAAYKTIVVRLLVQMRREGSISWSSIVDGTRWRRKPDSFANLSDALETTQGMYRRALWNDQPVYVEVWSEKEAISGVLYDVTSEWDVPLHVCKGYPSQTYLHASARELSRQRRPCFIYYFGDHDPSGLDITRKVDAQLREYAPRAEIHFERAGVTEAQISDLNLPTRPTKKTDSRSKGFSGESVEVDAIPPDTLRGIVRSCIVRHIDPDLLERTQALEEAERVTLDNLISRFGGAA